MRALRCLAVFTSVLLTGCGCGKKSCDPDKESGGCDGNTMLFCMSERHFDVDWGSHWEATPCAPTNVCRLFGRGASACVHAPPTPCDAQSFVNRCDGEVTLICTAPSSTVTEDWVIGVPSLCRPTERCVETDAGASCALR